MDFKEFIGIDVSKLTIDACIHSSQDVNVFENNSKGYKKLIKWIEKNSSFNLKNTIVVFEHTGLYSYNLSVFCEDNKLSFVALPGLEIKQSMGMVRGKTDEVDARRIALYGYRRRDELTPSKLQCKQLTKIKRLLTLREQLVKQRAALKTSLKETSSVFKVKTNQLLFQIQKRVINTLSKEINKIEVELKTIIEGNEELNHQYKLLVSVKGIGDQMAYNLIVYTDGFNKFNNARKFAAYCGIAPFPHSSGTSINKKNRVSHLANKKLKSLLNMCAVSAIQHSPEMKLYFQKRINEGKNKMCVINIIRNKLVHRAFAVIKRGTPYVEVNNFLT